MGIRSGEPERDEAWFEDLFRAHHRAVLAYARRRVEDADDVVSEVFSTAWRRRDDVPDPPRSWLLRTASNYVQHSHRDTGRRAALVTRATSRTEVGEDHSDAVIGRHDANLLITAALSRLQPSDQELLRLSAWEGLDHRQLAYVCGCSVAAVRVRLHRARRGLAAEVDRIEGTPERPSPTVTVEVNP